VFFAQFMEFSCAIVWKFNNALLCENFFNEKYEIIW
jgi:hypothetical protein